MLQVLLDAEGRAFLCDAGLAHGMTHGASHLTLVAVQGSTGFSTVVRVEPMATSSLTLPAQHALATPPHHLAFDSHLCSRSPLQRVAARFPTN